MFLPRLNCPNEGGHTCTSPDRCGACLEDSHFLVKRATAGMEIQDCFLHRSGMASTVFALCNAESYRLAREDIAASGLAQ